jgi:TatA/E family protein of Tat protein translocase
MFGIGFWEFIVIAVVVILAIGPDRMPGFFKTIGKTIRLFRKTTKDLKNTIGLDELLRDEPVRKLPKPAHVTPAPAPKPPEIRTYELTDDDRAREHPHGGVDLEDIRRRAVRAAEAKIAAAKAEAEAAAKAEAEKREAEEREAAGADEAGADAAADATTDASGATSDASEASEVTSEASEVTSEASGANAASSATRAADEASAKPDEEEEEVEAEPRARERAAAKDA